MWVLLRDMSLEKVERTLAGELGGVGFVRGAVRVGEGVSGALVDEDLHLALVLAMRIANGVDLILAAVIVGATEVDHDGAGRLLGRKLADAARVVADGADGLEGEVGAAGCREPAD